MSTRPQVWILALLLLVRTDAARAQKRDSVDIGRQYAAQLAALGEPDLKRSRDSREIYRVLWLRSFHESVAVRIVRAGSQYNVITSIGPVWGHPSTAAPRRDSVSLSAEEWAAIQLRTAMREFWTTVPHTEGIGLDGAQWILEGRRDGRYYAVDWWSPQGEDGAEGGYRRLVLEILSLGTVCVKPDAVY